MKYLLTTLSPSALISQLMTGVIAYYFLIADNYFGSSITTIIHHAHSLPVNKHLILLGILPVYIAIVIFGSALLSASVAGKVERIVMRPLQDRKSKISF